MWISPEFSFLAFRSWAIEARFLLFLHQVSPPTYSEVVIGLGDHPCCWKLIQRPKQGLYTHYIQPYAPIYRSGAANMWPKTWKYSAGAKYRCSGAKDTWKGLRYMLIYTNIQGVYTKNGIGQKSQKSQWNRPKFSFLFYSLIIYLWLFIVWFNPNFIIIN